MSTSPKFIFGISLLTNKRFSGPPGLVISIQSMSFGIIIKLNPFLY